MRKYYVFNSLETVKQHVSSVKTILDLRQLVYDLKESDCNLTQFRVGIPGVCSIDCCAGEKPYRHVFLTKEAYRQYGDIIKEEADGFTVLE